MLVFVSNMLWNCSYNKRRLLLDLVLTKRGMIVRVVRLLKKHVVRGRRGCVGILITKDGLVDGSTIVSRRT